MSILLSSTRITPTVIISLLLMFCSSNLHAFEDTRQRQKEAIPQAIIGLSTYAGRMTNDLEEHSFYVGGSLYMYFFNAALEARAFSDGQFKRDNVLQPYMGFGLGRLLQVQRGVDLTSTTRVRIVSEIAFNEWVDTRNHITLQGYVEQLHTSGKNKRRYGIALGYTF